MQRADVIFVFGEGGKIVERGSHGELVRKRGVYWGMVSVLPLQLRSVLLLQLHKVRSLTLSTVPSASPRSMISLLIEAFGYATPFLLKVSTLELYIYLQLIPLTALC